MGKILERGISNFEFGWGDGNVLFGKDGGCLLCESRAFAISKRHEKCSSHGLKREDRKQSACICIYIKIPNWHWRGLVEWKYFIENKASEEFLVKNIRWNVISPYEPFIQEQWEN